MVRNYEIEELVQGHPKSQPLHQAEGHIVQELVDTGRYTTTYRVATFMGELLYGLRYQSFDPSQHEAAVVGFRRRGARVCRHDTQACCVAGGFYGRDFLIDGQV
jgi:hypothetical protein